MTKLAVQRYLRGLGDGSIQPYMLHHGICHNLYVIFGSDVEMKFQELCFQWPEFSGNYLYPISVIYLGNCEHQYEYTYNKWDNTPYGDARRRLCTWASENWPSDEEIS